MSVSTEHERDSAPTEDGIVVELARDDVARKKFLKMAGRTMGSGAAATGLAAFIAACGSSSSKSKTAATSPAKTGASTGASTGSSTTSSGGANAGDIKIVNYALTLEYLEANFYKQVGASGLFASSPALPLLKEFGKEEQDHVTALTAAVKKLGGMPAAKVTGKFPLKSATSVAELAATVENLGAAAYLGQAPNIKNPEILAAALAIHTVEARHAATLNLLIKKSPTPQGAFGKPMSMSQVLAVVKPFIA
jgi:hypothetical protein